MSVILHGYWRSSAAYRVRIALNVKGLSYEQRSYDLRSGAQHEPQYRTIAPIGLVPALEVDGAIITQSLAILEWLEERFAEPALLPKAPADRAMARSMAALIACDIHPINNLRILNWLRATASADDDMIESWITHWISEGFIALEALVRRHGGLHCFGDSPTFADCALVPQIYNARRYNVDLSSYPSLIAVEARCAELFPFDCARPDRQPDADGGCP